MVDQGKKSVSSTPKLLPVTPHGCPVYRLLSAFLAYAANSRAGGGGRLSEMSLSVSPTRHTSL